jgi:hypothetical protein
MSLLIFLLFVKHQRPVMRTGISTSLITKHVTKMSKVPAGVVNAHLIVLYTEALRKTDLRGTFRAQADTLSTVFCNAYSTLVMNGPVDLTNPKRMSLTIRGRQKRRERIYATLSRHTPFFAAMGLHLADASRLTVLPERTAVFCSRLFSCAYALQCFLSCVAHSRI